MIHVLLVDDDADVCDTLPPAILSVDNGIKIHPVATVSGAVDLLYPQTGRPPFDLVLLDMIMKRREGVAGDGGRWLLHRLSLDWPTLPVIVYSGESDRSRSARLALVSAVAHVNKPAEPAVLASLIRRAVSINS